MNVYECPGRAMPPDEFVYCYRAGHACPALVAIREDRGGDMVSVTLRCPCCGDLKGAYGGPREWFPS